MPRILRLRLRETEGAEARSKFASECEMRTRIEDEEAVVSRNKEGQGTSLCGHFVESGEVSDPTSLAADASHLTICKRTGYLLINRHSEDAKPPQRFGPSVVSGCSFRGRIYIVDRDSVVLGPSRPTSDTPPRNAICSDPLRAPIFSYSVSRPRFLRVLVLFYAKLRLVVAEVVCVMRGRCGARACEEARFPTDGCRLR